MRRHDCEITDPQDMHAVLDRADWGTLALVSADGAPVVVPLNFVWSEGRVWFHGAAAGEKIATLKLDGRCSFLVVEAFAQIPSYAFDPQDACPATQFFRSVLVKGRVALVEDLEAKARALQALMVKLQPEGGFEPIRADGPRYQASLKSVAVLALTPEQMTGKLKLGQRLSEKARGGVERALESRGGAADLRTLEAMRPY